MKTKAAEDMRAEILKIRRQLSNETLRKLDQMEGNLPKRLRDALLNYKGSIFYIQKFSFGMTRGSLCRKNSISKLTIDSKTEKLDLQQLFVMKDYKDVFVEQHNQGSFAMSNNDFFIWNDHEVVYINLDQLKGHRNELKKLDFKVDQKQKLSSIVLVRVGSNPNTIVIKV